MCLCNNFYKRPWKNNALYLQTTTLKSEMAKEAYNAMIFFNIRDLH